jgi:hypothetical protein
MHKTGRLLYLHRPFRFHRRSGRDERHWLAEHPRLIAFLLGSLVTLLLLGLLSMIHVQMGSPLWPLFG